MVYLLINSLINEATLQAQDGSGTPYTLFSPPIHSHPLGQTGHDKRVGE